MEIEQEEVEKHPIDEENETIDYALKIIKEGMALSKENDFSLVSLDYTQLDLLNRMLLLAKGRGNQLKQLIEVMDQRKEGVVSILTKVKEALDRIETILPSVNIGRK